MDSQIPPLAIARERTRRGGKHSSLGLTLVELIVCMSMLAILIGLAIPSFSNVLSDWRRDSAIRDFMGDLQLARSTALRTSRGVVMCVTRDGLVCAAAADSLNWRLGWMVFSDLNGDDVLNNGETIVVLRNALVGLQLMQSNNVASGLIAFRSNGLLRAGNATVNVLAEGAGPASQVDIRMNTTGRAFLRTPVVVAQ